MSKRIIFLFTFFVFWLIFFPTAKVILDTTYNGWLQNFMILIMAFYFRKHIMQLFKGHYRWINFSVLSYCVICVVSLLINDSTISNYTTMKVRDGVISVIEGNHSTKSTIYFSLSLLSLLVLVERLSLENKVEYFLKYLWNFSLLLWIWVNIDAFTHVVIDEKIGGYVIGNKFHVCYYNLLVCVIYYLNHPNLTTKKEKMSLLFLIVVLLFACLHTQCSTMVVGTMAFASLVFLVPEKMWHRLSSASFIVSLLVVVDLVFFFFTTWVLQYPIVQDFIVDVLHEDLTLTGRLGIFENITESFSKGMWLGFGNGNSRVVSLFYTGVENPQNGLIEVFLNVGVVGCVVFLQWLYLSLKEIKETDYYKYPIVLYILTMIVVSTIEVPFGGTFMFFMILLLAERRKVEVKKVIDYGA